MDRRENGDHALTVQELFLALYAALRQANRNTLLLAVACGLIGIAVAFASNQAIAMLFLSRQYASATTDAQRAIFSE